jgi:hypothetical protein
VLLRSILTSGMCFSLLNAGGIRPRSSGRIASLVAAGVEMRRKQAESACGGNSHRGGGQEMAPVLIDNFGAYSRSIVNLLGLHELRGPS